MLNITVLYGSYKEPRMGIRAVQFLEKIITQAGHIAHMVDAKALEIPLLEKRYVDYAPQDLPEYLKELHTLYTQKTDAFLWVAGEYNGTFQPGLKNLLDYFYTEYFHRPSGLVTYSMGALGAPRVTADLRTLAGTLGMPAIPKVLSISTIHEKLDEKGVCCEDSLNQNASKFLKELWWYAQALKEARNSLGTP